MVVVRYMSATADDDHEHGKGEMKISPDTTNKGRMPQWKNVSHLRALLRIRVRDPCEREIRGLLRGIRVGAPCGQSICRGGAEEEGGNER